MIKKEFAWNQVYKIVMLIKEDYNSTFNDGEKNFKTWLKKLDNEVWNTWSECLQFTQHENLLLVRYGLHDLTNGMWDKPNSIYRECRSITLDLKYNSIVLAPFRKFFNIGEIEENSIESIAEKIANGKVITSMNKLDGSMQSARWYDCKVIMSGSKSLDENSSWRLKKGRVYFESNPGYETMVHTYNRFTFIFELIDLEDAHVVKYTKEEQGLYLLGARDVYTGEEMNYNMLSVLAEHFDIKIVEREEITLNEIIKNSKTIKSFEKEGWVIDIDGYKVKIKGDDYVNLHRCLTYVSSINVIIGNVADNTIDDLISKIPDEYKYRIKTVAKLIQDKKYQITNDAYMWLEKVPEGDKKTKMIWITENVPSQIRPYTIMAYYGKSFNVLKKSNQIDNKSIKDLGINVDYSAIFGVDESLLGGVINE